MPITQYQVLHEIKAHALLQRILQLCDPITYNDEYFKKNTFELVAGHFRKAKFATPISRNIFETFFAKRGQKETILQPKHLGSFRVFASNIFKKGRIVIPADQFKCYEEFVDDPKFITWIKDNSTSPYRTNPRFREKTFYLYTFDEKLVKLKNGKDKLIPGIDRSELIFLPGNKIKMLSYSAWQKADLEYIGRYKVIKGGEGILADMETRNGEESFFRLELYVGKHDPDIAIGTFSDFDINMFGGRAMMVKPTKQNSKNPDQKFFTRIKLADRKIIPTLAWTFLKDKKNSIFIVPTGVIDLATFKEKLFPLRKKKTPASRSKTNRKGK